VASASGGPRSGHSTRHFGVLRGEAHFDGPRFLSECGGLAVPFSRKSLLDSKRDEPLKTLASEALAVAANSFGVRWPATALYSPAMPAASACPLLLRAAGTAGEHKAVARPYTLYTSRDRRRMQRAAHGANGLQPGAQ